MLMLDEIVSTILACDANKAPPPLLRDRVGCPVHVNQGLYSDKRWWT